ncbi:hypothetical protein GOP47_0019559 [Adiantum capillus-veneris]|uniref:Uncharacterized protein n=1 Tax=Adiantum capillus-veneris TaxID=13818 RepID=A0A9D4UB97_ADICA|nr:hypothetical protein GOP47_0019559 [Adiantum capillus-veneris]
MPLRACVVAECGVIPDWVDAFGAGRVEVSISFSAVPAGARSVRLGQLLPQNLTQTRPHLHLRPSSNDGRVRPSWLSVVMVDPDAPSPSSATVANFLHWIVSNIPSNSSFFHPSHSGKELSLVPPKIEHPEPSNCLVGAPYGPSYLSVNQKELKIFGDEVMPYVGPTPPSGTHRYYILVFEQEKKLNVTTILDRTKFSVREFTKKYDLSYPHGGTFFRVKAGS